ncbi:antitoxin Xre/MbcA/ParS toxin-binding domain-containing protein [Sphingosinicella sp. YJ22]|uniref:antitoxin Xre/MbcA/ParS-like domain-containing protein n=1 Tax=Sphingosinicella sp. YJ22 TaxID=1104780 RepID=UPI00140E4D90|nr:antitoxin Xre/MbcA/ParS toxin-binding domain-containing protein [Sphingosinicella sp. YJ22]
MSATELERPIARKVAKDVEGIVARYAGELGLVAGELARIVGLVTSALVELPVSERRHLASQRDSADFVHDLARLLGEAKSATVGSGTGFGPLIARAEGRKRLAARAVTLPIEEWAGEVAGSTQLQRDLGIQRSTLHEWQRRGEVVGLLRGTRNHVFPTAQFIDGRPLKGIGPILAIARSPRVAWLWLVTPNPNLADRPPIDLLREDRADEVVEAAREAFDGQ